MNKYLISADIEGITGVISKEFSKENGRFYQLACRYMLNDVNAVAQGILNADFDAEIVVRDAHGAHAVNLDLGKLHPKAKLIQGWASIQNMFDGLEEDFKGAFLVGYHAGGDNTEAILGHTMHSIIHSVKVNGKKLNEAGLFALYAGHFNVPVTFISGDDHTIKEAKEQFGEEIVGVAVKKSRGRGCGESLSLERAKLLLEKNAADAVTKMKQDKFQPSKVTTPATLELKFHDTGVRLSVFQYIADILRFDDTYKSDSKERTITYQSDNVLLMLERLNMIMYLVYGVSSAA